MCYTEIHYTYGSHMCGCAHTSFRFKRIGFYKVNFSIKYKMLMIKKNGQGPSSSGQQQLSDRSGVTQNSRITAHW